KFTVACALLAFGTFWSLGGLLDEAKVWPLGDVTLLPLFAVYAVAGRLSAFKLRLPQAAAQGVRA
ncbi:MAG: High-affinity Fe2+/Pb2+ permease, partial [Thiomonas sp. 20-64-5]